MRIMNFPMSSSHIIMDLQSRALNMKGLKESSAWNSFAQMKAESGVKDWP